MQCRLNLINNPLNYRLSEIMPSYDLKFQKTETTIQAEDTSQEEEPPSTIHRGSTMMSNRLLKGGELMKQKEISTAKKLLQNTLKLGDKLKCLKRIVKL